MSVAVPPGLVTALSLLRADAPRDVVNRPEDWPRWEVLLPHVLAATAHSRDDLLAPGAASACMWLMDRAGTYLQTQGRYRDAVPLMRRALGIGERVHGPDDRDVAASLNNLATVLRDLGDPAAARPLAERALAIDERALGPEHPDVAIRLSNLALVLQDLGEPAAARPPAERALAIGERVLGPGHPVVEIFERSLAGVLQALGEHEAAARAARREAGGTG